jgi:4-diphosphocytidyl-2-C-methyl-D-erythritol kinase
MTTLRALAPGKVNLCLFVGAPRKDGLHPLASVVQSLTLADELTLEPGDGPGDEVVCAGVTGPNLAAKALAAFREATGWDAGPQRLEIVKRVPVAGGMGGGSGDAAAALRLAAAAAGIDDGLEELAVDLGADVPAQLRPGRALMLGAGERVVRLPDPEPFGVVIVALDAELSTPAVYREFDAGSQPRSAKELGALERELAAGGERVGNDLQDAARRLCPAIDGVLEDVLATGADAALVSGSGPTVFGLFPDLATAGTAAANLRGAHPRAIAAGPIAPADAEVRPA